jgi:hypothetical protein
LIALYFKTLDGRAYGLGPAPYFRMAGSVLQAGPDDREVGRYHNGSWRIGGNHSPFLSVQSSAKIHFEKDGCPCSGAYGPLDGVQIADRHLWYGGVLRLALARLDALAQSWHVYPSQEMCPVAVLSPGIG